tara:strand:+ start:3666 stop:4799 length:1134 start_codon:yes stop_codon:yes gene_type:complete
MLSGIEYGYSLIWCIIFSIIATCYLQEISSRIGLITKKGLGEILTDINNKYLRWLAIIFIFLSLFVGNSAYESGNISGTSMGIESFIGKINIMILGVEISIIPILIGIILIIVVGNSTYKIFEKFLIFLVSMMSLTFIVLAILSKPNFSEIVKGLVPSVDNNNFIYVIGLIGTTVVPYNLFLHSYVTRDKWKSKSDYKKSLVDTIISIMIGGIISLSIIITSASSQSLSSNEIKNAIDLGNQLSPLIGSFSKIFISVGLFCAGLTSSITAPIATSYALSGIFKYKPKWEDKNFKKISIIIILIGVIFSSLSYQPIAIIKFAQFINGLFLPVIAVFLLWSVNKSNLMGSYVNSRAYNLFGIFIIAISLLISYRSLVLI